MNGVKISLVVNDCFVAFDLYKKVFDAKELHRTSLSKGQNRIAFMMCGGSFQLFDENRKFLLSAPAKLSPRSVWFDLLVDDVELTVQKGKDAGFLVFEPAQFLEDFGRVFATIGDPFGYMWMLHEIVD